MAQRVHIDDVMRGRIIGRLERNQNQMDASRELGVPQSVISRIWRRFQRGENVSRRFGGGRPRSTSDQEDRYLRLTARRNRHSTASELSRDLAAATGTSVSRFTVYRRLAEGHLYARRPARCVPLTPQQRRARLNWSREHHAWTPEQWRHVLFTDESRFSLTSDSRRVFIWREPGTRFRPANMTAVDQYRGGGIMVWGGIILGSRTPLHVFPRGTVTGAMYRDDILDQYVRLFRGAVGPDFILMDDNARPHRAAIVDEYLEHQDIRRFDWPSRSPDLNPIEHVWDMLGRRVARRQMAPRSIPELREALVQEWQNIPQPLLDNLILSMQSRCGACVAVRGDHTYY